MTYQNSKIFKQVFSVVARIPKGKVMTYGGVAKKVKTTPRIVGFALHKNPDPKNIPCHRVVDRDGKVAKNYAFGGWKKQREILIKEGVKFKDDLRVNLWSVFTY